MKWTQDSIGNWSAAGLVLAEISVDTAAVRYFWKDGQSFSFGQPFVKPCWSVVYADGRWSEAGEADTVEQAKQDAIAAHRRYLLADLQVVDAALGGAQ